MGLRVLAFCQTSVRSLLEDHAGEETSRVPGRRETLYRHSKQLPHHAHVVRGEGVEHVPRLLVQRVGCLGTERFVEELSVESLSLGSGLGRKVYGL